LAASVCEPNSSCFASIRTDSLRLGAYAQQFASIGCILHHSGAAEWQAISDQSGVPMGKRKAARVSVSIPHDDHLELMKLADEYDVSLAWLMRHATADFFSRLHAGQIQLPLPLEISTGTNI